MDQKSKSSTKGAEVVAKSRKAMGYDAMPFQTLISLQPLVKFWKSQLDSPNQLYKKLAKEILHVIDQNPHLFKTYHDAISFGKENENLLDALFLGFMPLSVVEQSLAYAASPFAVEPFYLSVGLQRLLSHSAAKIDFEEFSDSKSIPLAVRAGILVLKKLYQVETDLILPYMFSVDTGDQQPRFYKAFAFPDFIDVKTRIQRPEISQDTIDLLLTNLHDEQLWLDTISPDVFYFEGFFFATLSDMTEVESRSRLRNLLLQSESLKSNSTFEKIKKYLRIFLDIQDLELGLAAMKFPYRSGNFDVYNIHYPILNSIDFIFSEENIGSVYEKSCVLTRMQILNDLSKIENPTRVERTLIDAGYQSLMVLPLLDNKRSIIGLMELASRRKSAFTHTNRYKLKDILPLFDTAMEDDRTGIENRKRDIIQSKFTNIHSSVQWKFDQVAYDFMKQQDNQVRNPTLQPVIFDQIYPVFGQIDVIGSTELRNQAIQKDLETNLLEVKSILSEIDLNIESPMVKKHLTIVSESLDDINRITPGEELEINTLLHNQIKELLGMAKDTLPDKRTIIEDYLEAFQSRQDFNKYQKQFQKTLELINNSITEYLEEQEIINQKTLPHYYQIKKTDGIEYDIFLGQSILSEYSFTQEHLQDFRRWQLRSMCEIARKLNAQSFKSFLQFDLTYLIFVFNNPIKIKFRLDEKQFDVEGVASVQYEVMKKRIEKAYDQDFQNRITKKNHITIVYLQDIDRAEYMTYLNELIADGAIVGELNELELSAEQGLSGVKAIQAPIRLSN